MTCSLVAPDNPDRDGTRNRTQIQYFVGGRDGSTGDRMKVHYFIKWNHFDLGYYVSPARFKRNVTLVPQEIHFVALLVCQIGEPVNVEEAEALEARLRAKMAANANALNSAVAQLSFPRGDRANDSQPKYVALAVIASE